MYIERNGVAQRGEIISENSVLYSDIEFLKNYYEQHGNYPLFSQVLLETRTDCNSNCKFCPQSHLTRPLQIMKWEIFEHVINELTKINFCGRIAFFMTNEPLLETRLLEIIRYARNKSARFFLDITTNGKVLNSILIDKLLLAGLDNININDYQNNREQFSLKISNNLIDVVKDFRHNPKISFNKRSTDETLSNYAGTIKGERRKLQSFFCNLPFRKLSISAEGNVILCCNDYTYKTNFGNVMCKSLNNIWFSNELNEFRSDLLNEKRNGICNQCDEFQKYSVFV